MSLLVTGSIGLDTLETPIGKAADALGGSSVYFALAASHFTHVRVVGVVGDDFDMEMFKPLRRPSIDLSGIEVRAGSQTFRWHGKYVGTMAEAETLDVRLNVLTEAGAKIPDEFRDSECVFLANTHPALQREVALQFPSAALIVCDTMNLWIEGEPDELKKTLGVVHGLVLNDAEARMLTGQSSLLTAARDILKLGPRFVVIKKGEHGSMLVSEDDLFVLPAYPTTKLVDPTGCGDSFAGAMMGYLDAARRYDGPTLRAAMARGSVVASYVIESFSVDASAAVTAADIDERLSALAAMSRFE